MDGWEKGRERGEGKDIKTKEKASTQGWFGFQPFRPLRFTPVQICLKTQAIPWDR